MLTDGRINTYRFKPSEEGLEVNKNEILRYAKCQNAEPNSDMYNLMEECIRDTVKADAIDFASCLRKVSIRINGSTVLTYDSIEEPTNGSEDYATEPVIVFESHDLAINLKECKEAYLMVATVGFGMDRLIRRYSVINPSKALFMQAIGAERVETLCDRICTDIGNANYPRKVHPRFSPGYGDLDLSVQKKFLEVLDAGARIGVTVNDGFLMSPSKTVTAIIGLE